MANSVPSAPPAPSLGLPTTGAAAESKELFGVLLNRGQDFINRTILALNNLASLPSQLVPRVPVVDWTDPGFIRPAPIAGARPEAPIIPSAAAQAIIFDWLSDPDPAVRRSFEAATFARAAARATAESARLIDEAKNRWAANGFDIPPGMLNSLVDQAQTRAADATMQASFEAMVQAQNLQVEKYKICISEGLGALLRVYSVQAQEYVAERNADAQALKTEADVYSARVQALVQRITVQLRGTEIENNVLIANLQLIERAMGEIANAYATLASGATSALHANTGFTDSASYQSQLSEGWDTRWNFSADY